MADIVQLVPRSTHTDEDGNGTGDVAAWLRSLADALEKGAYGTVGAAVIVMREDALGDTGSQFALRTRRCNMNFVEQAGTLHMMHHDMMHADA